MSRRTPPKDGEVEVVEVRDDLLVGAKKLAVVQESRW